MFIKSLVLLALSALLSCVLGQPTASIPEPCGDLKLLEQKKLEKCGPETQMTMDIYKEFLNTKKTNKKINCFLGCIMHEAGMINAQGEFNQATFDDILKNLNGPAKATCQAAIDEMKSKISGVKDVCGAGEKFSEIVVNMPINNF